MSEISACSCVLERGVFGRFGWHQREGTAEYWLNRYVAEFKAEASPAAQAGGIPPDRMEALVDRAEKMAGNHVMLERCPRYVEAVAKGKFRRKLEEMQRANRGREDGF